MAERPAATMQQHIRTVVILGSVVVSLMVARGCFDAAPKVAAPAEPAQAAVPAEPFTQLQRQEFADKLRESLDLSERVMALALASVQMTSRVNAVEQMRLARERLFALGERLPKAPKNELQAAELANQADIVLAVRMRAAGFWLDYLDDGKPSQAADARQRIERAELLTRELRERLQAWQPAAPKTP